MKSSEETFAKRVNALEKLHQSQKRYLSGSRRIEELEYRLSELIGKEKQPLLLEYTVRLVKLYNQDIRWFYNAGFKDGCAAVKPPSLSAVAVKQKTPGDRA